MKKLEKEYKKIFERNGFYVMGEDAARITEIWDEYKTIMGWI